jgi:DNA-binding NtrC family response regulator
MLADPVMVIETDRRLRSILSQRFRQEGFDVAEAHHESDVFAGLAATSIRVVILGLGGMRRNGISIMRRLRKQYPDVSVITINSYQQLDLSIEAMHLGAYDDFLIPFDLDGLISCIRKALSESGHPAKRHKAISDGN